MFEDALNAITPWFHDWGLVIIFVATFLESSIVVASVLPGETVLLLGGFFASPSSATQAQPPPLDLGSVMAVALAGALLGDLVGYLIGRIGGRALVRRFGRFVFLPEERLPVLEGYFRTYGTRAVVLGRFAPFVRSVRALVAGTARMPFLRFMVPAAFAATLWACGIAAIGFLLGESWELTNRYLGAGGVVIFVLLVVGFVITWRRVRARVERELGEQVAGPGLRPRAGVREAR